MLEVKTSSKLVKLVNRICRLNRRIRELEEADEVGSKYAQTLRKLQGMCGKKEMEGLVVEVEMDLGEDYDHYQVVVSPPTGVMFDAVWVDGVRHTVVYGCTPPSWFILGGQEVKEGITIRFL